MNVRLELPHTVVPVAESRAEKPDIIIDRAELDPVANKVTLEVENQGSNFGRVMETQLRLQQEEAGRSRSFQCFRIAKEFWKFL